GYVRREARERYLYFHPRITPSPRSTVGSWARLTERLLPAGSRTEHTPLWPDVPPARPIHRLSTGERKRLLLDALLRRSGPLILDEPYEHLSPDGKAALTRLLHERAAGAVVVVATNQATERAGQWGGLRLADGHAQRIGPRQEVVS
ncbi:MAG TPA: hypothetical protein VK966_03575, partial [Longimicrobiales bacterium]|nr:hypothetical protein [Longimicrobiales bacterium]